MPSLYYLITLNVTTSCVALRTVIIFSKFEVSHRQPMFFTYNVLLPATLRYAVTFDPVAAPEFFGCRGTARAA